VQEWTGGYVSNIDYTYGYYPELNPVRACLGLLNRGVSIPKISHACELGYGQGMSVNLHAAASATEWWGTDFNPAQAGFARELGECSETNRRLFDESFAEFCQRPDLPDFDFIGLHGIWSWVSDENRRTIVDFVRRKLRVGGILYVSYNTFPGWAAFSPMRELMVEHSQHMSASAHNIADRIDDALKFADALLQTNPMYSRANPQIASRLQSMQDKSRHYLAHEYFNRDWHPMSYSSMAKWLNGAKVDFVSSANFLDQIESINFSKEQIEFINAVSDPTIRESVKDFMVNQQFRRDYWVKGPRRMGALDQVERIRDVGIVLLSDKADVSLQVNTAQGQANMASEIYLPILETLGDHQKYSVGSLHDALQSQVNLNIAQVMQAVLVLISNGHIAPCQSADDAEAARKKTDGLNSALIRKARHGFETNSLASPVTGGGIPANRVEQLFVMSLRGGHKDPSEWAQDVLQVLESQGQKLIKDKIPIETREETQQELRRQAKEFEAKKLPVLKTCQVI